MDTALFDHFPEPVFYLEQRQICYSNEAALAREPQWTAGSEIPAALDLEPDEEGVFSCALGGQEFQAAATRTGKGLLLVLRHPVRAPSSALLTALSIRLRETIQNIQAAGRMLTPLVEESGERGARMHLAVLNQSFYRLLRLARHLDLAERAGQEDRAGMAEEALDLAEFCRETAYGAARLAERAGVKFRESVPDGVIPTAGDRELLEIMLLELISNAIKAAGRDGQAGVKLSSNGSRAMITVWDDGPGMSQADLTAMMDGDSPESLPKPGAGLRLGLPIARYIASAHGGAILLESREGKGLQATVSLPLRKAAGGALRTPRHRPDEDGGFSRLLIHLADGLPWQVYEE